MYPLLVGKLIYDFYPRSPCGERPKAQTKEPNLTQISIHALLAESDGIDHAVAMAAQAISIHALLAESDINSRADNVKRHISIHALLAESDPETTPSE